MKQIAVIDIKVNECESGQLFRYYHTSGGWHYLTVQGNVTEKVSYANKDVLFTNRFSHLSKEARVLKKDVKQVFALTAQDVEETNKIAVLGLLSSEKVEAYLSNKWVHVYVPRQTFNIRTAKVDRYTIEFTFETKKYSTVDRKLYLNGELLELEDSEAIPINKQTNDIAELKDRQTDFTADFKIERTRNNSRIFKQAGLAGNLSTLPYTRTPARYVQDGVELIRDGYLVLISTTEDYFNCAVYSGNSDFFKSIETLKLSSLDLSDLNHQLTAGVFGLTFNDLKWLMFEPGKDGNALASHNASLLNFRPFVSVRRLFEQIVTAQGWTPTGDLADIDSWMMCAQLQPILTDYAAKAALNSQASSLALLRVSNSSILSDKQNSYIYRAGFGVVWPGVNDARLVRPSRTGKYQFTVSGQFLMHGATQMRVSVGRYSLGGWRVFRGEASEVIAINTNNDILQDFSTVYEYEITPENINSSFLAFAAEIDATGTGVFNSFSVSVKLVESEIAVGDMLNISSLMPDLDQSKFIKNVANMYGLIPQPNSANRTINFWKFDRVISHKAIAKDWSEYLHEGESPVTYKVGSYAALNTLKYKESEEVPKGYADGTIRIENQTLEATKDLFTLDFKPSLDILYGGKAISLIPVAEKQEDGSYKNAEEKDPRVLLSKPVTGTPVTIKVNGVDTVISSYDAACFLDETTGRSLSFEQGLLPNNYSGLQRVLSRARVFAPKMYLPTTEILQLDHSIPVYLVQHSAYYYVNKVNGYKPNSLTSVELIEIP